MEITWNKDEPVWIWHQPKEGPFVVIDPFEELTEPFDTVRGVRVDGYVVIKPTSGDKTHLRYHKESVASCAALGGIVSIIVTTTLLG